MVDAQHVHATRQQRRIQSRFAKWEIEDRLPTPPPPGEDGGTVMPSEGSGSRFLAPPLLSLSKSTSSSSLSGWDESQTRFISALPSPSISVAGSSFTDLEENMSVSAGGKTSSFFSSSFSATPPPSLLVHRSSSVSVRGKHGDASAVGVSAQPPNSHPRSASAERSPNGRSESANSIFVHRFPTPAPPPNLTMTSRDEQSRPRSESVGSPTRQKRGVPDESTIDGLPTRGYVPLTPPAFRRKLLLLDEPNAGLTASPVSPVGAQMAPFPQEPHHIYREAQAPDAGNLKLQPDSCINGDDVELTLVRLVGEGAFSTVWLAMDVNGQLGNCAPQERRKSESVARRKDDRRMAGLAPRLPLAGFVRDRVSRQASIVLDEKDGEGAMTPLLMSSDMFGRRSHGRLVAVKMLERSVCNANDRTRISFVREVEVLRHISHPSIVSYLHSFTTPTHHCLVLEYLAGGELFALLDNDKKYSMMTETLLRRMFGELARAVGWMHGVALVHRDIKLENIILTCDPFDGHGPLDNIDHLPSPLLKLTDFGLSRFIDVKTPLLATRCGSESYAAPEIVMGSKYDGRQTDAWACGVVLYALATRILPFDPAEPSQKDHKEGRKAYLFRIAKGSYTWPTASQGIVDGKVNGSALVVTEGLKKVVGCLLVRDPAKRARVVDLWDEEWMRGEGAPSPPHRHGIDADPPESAVSAVGHLVDGDSIDDVARQEHI